MNREQIQRWGDGGKSQAGRAEKEWGGVGRGGRQGRRVRRWQGKGSPPHRAGWRSYPLTRRLAFPAPARPPPCPPWGPEGKGIQ